MGTAGSGIKNLTEAFKTSGKSRDSLAVMACRERLYFLSGRMEKDIFKAGWMKTLPLEKGNNEDMAQPGMISALKNEIKEIAAKTAKTYVTVNLIIPDPVTGFVSFSSKNQGALSNWKEVLSLRMEEKTGLKRQEFVFRASKVESPENKLESYAFSAARRLLNTIEDCFYEQGIALSSSAPGFSFIFNSFSASINGKACGIFTLEPDYWTFALVSASGAPVYIVSRWYGENSGMEAAMRAAVSEVERKLRAFGALNNGINMEKILVIGANNLTGVSAGLLNERFNCECVESNPGQNAGEGLEAMPISLLAAAGII